MSPYQGRRAPNVSQYIANLNTIPSAADVAGQQDFAHFEDDLAMFTNTQFFDFDMNQPVSDMPGDMAAMEQQRRARNASQEGKQGMAFINQPNYYDFNFPNNQNQHQNVVHVGPHSLPPSPPNGVHGAFNPVTMSQPTVPTAAAFASSPSVLGEKRRASAVGDMEDDSRVAAEEDKRRRNTAASARFRVKKKQREQALEKSAKEMSDKVAVLEARVGQLEMENKWLKGLITEKKTRTTDAVVAPGSTQTATTAVAARAAETQKEPTAAAETHPSAMEQGDRSTEERKDGVGTSAETVEA